MSPTILLLSLSTRKHILFDIFLSVHNIIKCNKYKLAECHIYSISLVLHNTSTSNIFGSWKISIFSHTLIIFDIQPETIAYRLSSTSLFIPYYSSVSCSWRDFFLKLFHYRTWNNIHQPRQSRFSYREVILICCCYPYIQTKWYLTLVNACGDW